MKTYKRCILYQSFCGFKTEQFAFGMLLFTDNGRPRNQWTFVSVFSLSWRSGEEKQRRENTERGLAEQVRFPSWIFIMSCQSFFSAQQLSSALIPPNLPHLSLLSLFSGALLRRPASFIKSRGIEFLQLSI